MAIVPQAVQGAFIVCEMLTLDANWFFPREAQPMQVVQ